MRMVLIGVLAGALAWLSACAPSIPDTPVIARSQIPQAAPHEPWCGQGRMEVVVPGKRISCSVIVRGLGEGHARMALFSDEGLLLADLSSTDSGYTVHQAIPDLNRALPHIGRMLRQSYGHPAEHDGHWCDGHWQAYSGSECRSYGGDPLLLRTVTGSGLDMYMEDYRLLGMELVALQARAIGPFGITLRLRLDPLQVRQLAPTATPPSSPAPTMLVPRETPAGTP